MAPYRVFRDRAAAGAELAAAVIARRLRAPVIVLGLPRGGVPVAFAVASALGAPLDVMVARKIGMPGEPELAIGAIAAGNVLVQEPHAAHRMLHGAAFAQLIEREQAELERRERAYRRGRPPLDLQDRTVVLVDDGLATGATMLAAIRAARAAGARRVVAAAPVASEQAAALAAEEADECVVLQAPPYLSSIGEWYERFEQLDDAEVLRLLAAAGAAEKQ